MELLNNIQAGIKRITGTFNAIEVHDISLDPRYLTKNIEGKPLAELPKSDEERYPTIYIGGNKNCDIQVKGLANSHAMISMADNGEREVWAIQSLRPEIKDEEDYGDNVYYNLTATHLNNYPIENRGIYELSDGMILSFTNRNGTTQNFEFQEFVDGSFNLVSIEHTLVETRNPRDLPKSLVTSITAVAGRVVDKATRLAAVSRQANAA